MQEAARVMEDGGHTVNARSDVAQTGGAHASVSAGTHVALKLFAWATSWARGSRGRKNTKCTLVLRPKDRASYPRHAAEDQLFEQRFDDSFQRGARSCGA